MVMKQAIKRIMDVVISVVTIVLVSPFLIVVPFMIIVSMGFPVLFKQERAGRGGKSFILYKFRTMAKKEKREPAESGNDRIGFLGRFLRTTSLDELPQLWNVLKGDMSLVGPRPLLIDYLPLYSPEQARRHKVKPGITGWAQINGRNATTWEERFKLDVWYVDHRGLWLDLKILALTVVKIIRRKGVTPEGRASLERFKGSNR